jgi:hypothetical protein
MAALTCDVLGLAPDARPRGARPGHRPQPDTENQQPAMPSGGHIKLTKHRDWAGVNRLGGRERSPGGYGEQLCNLVKDGRW